MQLFLQDLVPIPLRDKVNASRSDIWKRERTFNQGNCIFIQAPSGTGKTTLIHMLYGIRKDFSGMLHWDTYNIASISKDDLSQLRAMHVSVVFQDMRLFPELTTWENLEVKRLLTNSVAAEDVERWLQRLGLGDKKDSLAGTLSYGEQQRVAIVRALVQPFEWLLMDEPFSHLDKANTDLAIALITEVVQMNRAGMILADLDDNDHFFYTQKIAL